MKQLVRFLISIILCFAVVFTFVGCGNANNSSKKEDSLINELKTSVKYQLKSYCLLNYGVGVQNLTYTIRTKDEDTYYVSGRITVLKDGSSYSGTYEIRAEYDEDDEDHFDLYDLKVSSLRK